MAAAGHSVATEIMLEIDRQLNHMKNKTKEGETNIAKTRQEQESHSISYYRHQQFTGILTCFSFFIRKIRLNEFIKMVYKKISTW